MLTRESQVSANSVPCRVNDHDGGLLFSAAMRSEPSGERAHLLDSTQQVRAFFRQPRVFYNRSAQSQPHKSGSQHFLTRMVLLACSKH